MCRAFFAGADGGWFGVEEGWLRLRGTTELGPRAARLFVAANLIKLTLLLARYDFSLGTYRTCALISTDVLFQAETAQMAAYRIVRQEALRQATAVWVESSRLHG